ncbi:MAG: Uma2 family endonuclease [Anaerolineae bacterium]|nr:Uma2 family endonuclease [Phycisphaerae bacterium]
MTTVAQPEIHGDVELLVLEGVSWETYEALLKNLDDSGQRVRVTYDEGRMCIVSPLPKHEKWKSLIGQFGEVIADERDIPINTFGSTTWKRRDRKKGLEPDECFYVQREPQVRGKLDFDLRRDPPPDLAIEIDIRRHPVDRFAVYAGLEIPEIWNFNGKKIETFLLNNSNGKYDLITTSAAFPFLKPADLKQFLDRYTSTDQNSLMREVRAWTRSTL